MRNKKERLEDLLSQCQFNGNLLVAEEGKILFTSCQGVQNMETKAPLTLDTAFNLASVSKSLTALGILLLAQKGKLSLSDDLTVWLPNFPYDSITIEQLLTHSSGVPDYMELFAKYWDPYKIATNQDMLDLLIAYQPALLFTSGERMEYSNTGYVLLALIIEKVTGESFAKYMRKALFQTVDMIDSFIIEGNVDKNKIASGYTNDVYKGEDVLPGKYIETAFTVPLDGLSGDGGVYSTVFDLWKLDRALHKGDILSPELLEAAFKPSKQTQNTSFQYGYGWIIEDHLDYGKIVWHSGGWPGYATIFKRYVTEDKTIIFLRNSDQDVSYEEKIIEAIENILFDQPYEIPVKPKKQRAVKQNEALLKQYIGKYKAMDMPELMVEVTLQQHMLYLQMPSTMKLMLNSIDETHYFIRNLNISVQFEGQQLTIDTGENVFTCIKQIG